MRSIKTMLLIAAMAIVTAAFAAPVVASASNWSYQGHQIASGEANYQEHLVWSKGGSALTGESGSLEMNGRLNLEGEIGSIDCAVSMTANLNADSGTGQLSKFNISRESCKTGGFIGATCGSGPPTSVVANGLPWNVSTSGTEASPLININNFNLTYTVCGEELPVTFTGSIVATPNDPKEIANVSLSGTMEENVLEGKVTVKSTTLSASPAGTYGIIKQGTSNFMAAVSGTLGWAGELGSLSCSVSGTVALKEGGEGRLNPLNWHVGSCETAGWFGTCKLTSVSDSGASVVDKGSYIAIKGISINLGTVSGCGFSAPFMGELKANPNNINAISSTGVEGVLVEAETIHEQWTGSLNWSPAGVVGL